jgi:hypothetical protein
MLPDSAAIEQVEVVQCNRRAAHRNRAKIAPI